MLLPTHSSSQLPLSHTHSLMPVVRQIKELAMKWSAMMAEHRPSEYEKYYVAAFGDVQYCEEPHPAVEPEVESTVEPEVESTVPESTDVDPKRRKRVRSPSSRTASQNVMKENEELKAKVKELEKLVEMYEQQLG